MMAVVSVFSASAQDEAAYENGNRDEEGNIVRGGYITNGMWDNWWVEGAIGMNLFNQLHSGHSMRPAFDININAGKWVTPSVGLRAGLEFYRASGKISGSKEKINFIYPHADVLWNVSNAWSGYKETRFWDISPYYTSGWIFTGVNIISKSTWTNGVGLYNTFRFSDRLHGVLDLRTVFFRANRVNGHDNFSAITSISVGVSYSLGKTNWKRLSTALEEYSPITPSELAALNDEIAKLQADNKALNKDNAGLKDENAGLNDKVKDLEDQLAAANARKKTVTPGAVYFVIGHTDLSVVEKAHLEFYVKNVIEQDANATFVLTGYADKDTGGKKRNQYLSQKRVDYVVSILKSEYGISEDRIIVKAVGAESEFKAGQPELNRCVALDYAE